MKLIIIDTSVIIVQLVSQTERRWGKPLNDAYNLALLIILARKHYWLLRITDLLASTIDRLERYWESATIDAQIYLENAIAYINQNGWLPGLHDHECKVIWVEDRKPYWRSSFCPDYKANRATNKPEIFKDVYQVFDQANVARLAFTGYEADDIAAAIVRLWSASDRRNIDQVFLATVDSDWLGLIIDHNIFWCNTRDHAPRLRQRSEIFTWLRGKWNKQSKKKQRVWQLPNELLFKCSDIWAWKIATGDTADNVMPDGASHIVDLLAPPRMHDLVESKANEIKQAIACVKVVEKNGWKKSQQMIFALGCSPPLDILFVPQNQISK